jgi:serine/threonine protein kinase
VDEKYPRGDALGSGGVGTVYKARHLALELDVALKELRDVAQLAARVDPSTVARRLETELRAQAALRHPGIVPILDLDCNRPRPYCVMELMPGGNLRQKIDAGGGKPLPVERAMRWFVQVAEALAFAHRAGVTHGNLKPENVLFDALGNARLGDFGMQRLVETAGEGGARVFLAGGGVAYLAPEQVAGTVKDAVRADIYSLGILLYEILAGKVPGRRAPDPSKANSDAPSALDEVFDLMTQDAPDDRYEKLQDVLADIYGAFPDRNIGGLGDLVLFSGPNDEPEKSAGGKRKR